MPIRFKNGPFQYVYFVRNPLNGLIKIGTSYHVHIRVRTIENHWRTEMEFLGMMDGVRSEEKAAHLRLGDYRVWTINPHTGRIETEWFVDSIKVRAFIEANRQYDRPPRRIWGHAV